MPMTSAAHDHARLHEATGADAVTAAIAVLRARGERVTAPRRAVLVALASRPDHLTADEVAEMLAAQDVHRATVYRALDLLTESGAVLRRHVAGAATFHLAATAAGHEHLHGHCRGCGAVVPLPVAGLDAAAAAIAAATGFTLEPAHSTLTGVCAECAAR